MKSLNKLKRPLGNKDVLYGTWSQMGSPEFCELAGASGADFVIIDMEHGSFGIETAAHMIRAVETSGAVPIVRVADESRAQILKALDARAAGVMVPNVSSADMARRIVAATRYAPDGSRGACSNVPSNWHGLMEWEAHQKWVAENLSVIALIETPNGFDNFDEIIAVPGIDTVALGPFDLSQALGLNGDWRHPQVQNRQKELISKAMDQGVDVIVSIFEGEQTLIAAQVAQWQDLGVASFVISSDRFTLAAAYGGLFETMKQARSRRIARV